MIVLLPMMTYLYFYLKRIVTLFWPKPTVWQKFLIMGAAAAVTIPAGNLYGFWAMILLHVTGFGLAVDVAAAVLRWTAKSKKEEQSCRYRENMYRYVGEMRRYAGKLYRSGLIPVLLTAAVVFYGWLNMQAVRKTEYTVYTDKAIRNEGYRILFLSDLHAGTTMNMEKLEEICEEMEESHPDAVILGGDIVDEGTTLTQVQDVFRLFSGIDSTYGVFYIYGNHDKGSYAEDCDYTQEQLADAITENGIRILEDETEILNAELTISGRRDRTDCARAGVSRLSSGKLLDGQTETAYHIVVDHQPRKFEENEQASFDLMLSGHTHGGQMWPVGLLTTLTDRDTVNYGYAKKGELDVIVSSGIAGLGYPVRTGKHCEYVVVEIKPEQRSNEK